MELYLFAVRFIQAFQMIGLVVSAFSLVLLQSSDLRISGQRAVFIAVLGFTAYAIKQASGAVTIMQDLVRYRAIFDADRAGKPTLQRVQ